MKLDEDRFPLTARKDCSPKEQLRYDFLMKLFGLSIDMGELGRKTGTNAHRLLWPEIFFFSAIGALRKRGNLYHLTRRGQYYWVLMMREFFVAVNNFRDFCRGQAAIRS
jgi:menaquinone C8-methyltransferase